MMALSSKKAADFLLSFNSRQNWSFPDTMIYYILMNPSTSKVYEKLIHCCKYVFIKNPIVIVTKIAFFNNRWQTTYNERYVNIYKIASKIWIFLKTFYLSENNAFSSLIPKVFKCDINDLKLFEQNISFNDLKFIASNCKRIWFSKVFVMNDNDSIVPLQNILEILPYVKDFEYWIPEKSSHIITSKTVKELLRMPHFSKISDFKLFQIPEDFDIECFYEYVKRNNKTKIRLQFSGLISNQYKTHVKLITDEILETKNHDYKVPFIYFSGMYESSSEKLWNLFPSC